MNELQIELECDTKKFSEKGLFINELLNKLVDNGLSQSCAISISELIIKSFQNNKVVIFDAIREQAKDAMAKVIVVADIDIEMLFREWLKNEELTND